MNTKNKLKRARSKAFAQRLIEHNPGTPLSDLQASVGITDEPDCLSGGLSSGRTLERWMRGANGAQTLEALQHAASLAVQRGLLPPLRKGGLRRADLFGVNETLDRDKKYAQQRKNLDTVQKARAKYVSAALKYAAAIKILEADEEIVTIDASCAAPEEHSQEAHHRRVLSMAHQISQHAEVRLW